MTRTAMNAIALAAALLAPVAWAAPPFTVNANGTVTDTVTQLMWDQCANGQSGANCATGAANQLTWAQALAVAPAANGVAYKGYTDWRVPNVSELESLVNLTADNPAIDTTAFPNTPAAGLFWSSTTHHGTPNAAWYVRFGDGGSDWGQNKTVSTNSYVRLVRGGQARAAFDAADTIAPVITAALAVAPNNISATASVTVSEAATGFWMVQPAGSPAPSAAALAAQGPGQQVAMAGGVPAAIAVAGLQPSTAYTLYFVAVDTLNLSAVGSANFTTLAQPLPGAANAIPTLGEWALALLALLIVASQIGLQRLSIKRKQL